MIVVIRFLVWCVHFIAVTMPGYSRDGPPCIVEFAGVKSKPASPIGMASSAGVWTLFAKGHIKAHCAHGKRRLITTGNRSLSFARNRFPGKTRIEQ